MIRVVAAPTNLGLRPPAPGAEPGCRRAPEVLADSGLVEVWESRTGGPGVRVEPAAYVDDADPAAGRLRNQDSIVRFSRDLASTLGRLLAGGEVPVVVGGDCSLLIGVGLSLRERGRFALVHVDGHTDFRHPGNSPICLSAAGEDLAIVTGRHWPAVSDVDGLGPYFDPDDVVHVGCREDDEHLDEARDALGLLVTAADVLADVGRAGQSIVEHVSRRGLDGYWVHVDLDVLDPSVMPAVDSPDPGGLTADTLARLLGVIAPGATGVNLAIYDPDLDPDRTAANTIVEIARNGLAEVGVARTVR